MKDNLYTIVEFNENDKWFVIGETVYNNEKYEYLIKVMPDENDFIDEYMIVNVTVKDNEEYFKVVRDPNLIKEVMPFLLPVAKEIINNPRKALEILNKD